MKKALILASGLEDGNEFIPLLRINHGTWIEKLIDILHDKDYRMIYLVVDRRRYDLIRLLVNRKYPEVIIITKELYGEDTGGELFSICSLVKHKDRILLTYRSIELDGNLFDIADLLYTEFRYNTAVTHRVKGKNLLKNPIYLNVKKNKLISSFTRVRGQDFFFSGLMLLRGSFFKWLERRLYRRPELPNIDMVDVLNDYLSSGGKIYAYIY